MEQASIPEKEPTAPAAGKLVRSGFSQRRAGLGVLTVSRDKAARQRILAWKLSSFEDEGADRGLCRRTGRTHCEGHPR